jgi:hypothetical protein
VPRILLSCGGRAFANLPHTLPHLLVAGQIISAASISGPGYSAAADKPTGAGSHLRYFCIHGRTRVLIVTMPIVRPAWWCYPERCANGHEWGPGLIIVSWVLCDCPAARAASGDGAAGHLAVHCGVKGCRSVWCRPRHATGGRNGAGGQRVRGPAPCVWTFSYLECLFVR